MCDILYFDVYQHFIRLKKRKSPNIQRGHEVQQATGDKIFMHPLLAIKGQLYGP